MKHTLTTLFLLLSLGAFAQTFTVTGSLVEGTYNVGIPYANVGLFRAQDTVFSRGATTKDMTGSFEIKDVAPGTYLMKITAPGFPTRWQELTVSGDLKLDPIEMTVNLKELKEVMITAQRPLYAMDGEKNLYNTAEDPTVQSGTAADALRSAPGVEVDIQGNVTLRGVASVEIWINGQPSHLDQESLRQYLKTLPASSIQRIEVITNPSARYSTGGGVINIVTSQSILRNDFLSLSMMGSAKEGVKPALNPWLSYVHSNEKMTLNLYGAPQWSFDRSESLTHYTMRNPDGSIADTAYSTGRGTNRTTGFYAGGNLDWNIDSVTTLSAWVGSWGGGTRSQGGDTTFRMLYPTGMSPLQWHYSYFSFDTSHYLGAYGGVSLTHKFDTLGRRIDLTLSGFYNNNGSSTLSSRQYLNFDSSYSYFTDYLSLNSSLDFEANYTHPFSKESEMELGCEYGYGVAQMGRDWWNEGLFDSVRSYQGLAQSHEAAAYATYQRRFGNFTMKLGLRAEENIKLCSVVGHPEKDDTRPYFHLVPSLHLTYRTEKMDNFKLNYTYRSANPSASDLIDLEIINHETFSLGNPDLLCPHTHNLEVGWTRFLPKVGSIGVEGYYKANTNEVQRLYDVAYHPFFSRVVTFDQPVNIGSSYTAGGQLNLSFRPMGFMMLRVDCDAFYNSFTYSLRGEEPETQGKMTYKVRASFWTKVWKCVDLFAMANYSTPTLGLYSTNTSWKSVDLGLSADLLERKLSLFLAVGDLFDWNRWDQTSTNPYYTGYNSHHESSRTLRFGLTWRLGKMELEAHAKGQQQQ